MLTSTVGTIRVTVPGIDQCEEIQIESRRNKGIVLGPKYWSLFCHFCGRIKTANQVFDPYSLILTKNVYAS
jgi:hypothetical protein